MSDETVDLVEPHEAAKLVKLKEKTLTNWRSLGTGPRYVKFGAGRGARIYYLRSSLRKWIAEHEVEPGELKAS